MRSSLPVPYHYTFELEIKIKQENYWLFNRPLCTDMCVDPELSHKYQIIPWYNRPSIINNHE